MTTATRPHAPSRSCYQAGCRTEDCVREGYRYRKQLDLEHARGQYRRRDAAQTRAHIHRLAFAGWTVPQIATASGVSKVSIYKLNSGAQSTVAHWRAAAILNIRIGPPPADEKHVDATGSMRRLRALCVIGHTLTSLAPRLGMTRDRLKVIANTPTVRVRTEEAAAIARLYRRLAAIPGTSPQVRTFSRNRGWHGPLAWDETTIDDPAAKPDVDDGYTPLHPNTYDPYRRSEIEHLLRSGASTDEIHKRTGASPSYITQIRAEMRAGQRRRPLKRDLETAA